MIKIKTKFFYGLVFFLSCLFSFASHAREKSELKIQELKHEKKVTLDEAQRASQKEMLTENPLEKNLIESMGKAIKRLTKLGENLKKDSLARSKILNKLVEMSLEQASYITTREHRKFDKLWDSWYKKGRKGPEPTLDEETPKKYYQSVIEKANYFLSEFPKNDSKVLVYFQKAVAYQYLDKYAKAIEVFQNITDEYPDHPLASEAFFEVGSYYFDRDSFRLAQINLESVLKFKDASRVDWTYYKLGWIEFNQGYFKECLAYWKKAISLTLEKEKESGKENLLKKQVLKDMVFVFTELGQIEEALEYYKKFGSEDNISKFLFYLAQTYFEQGKIKKAEGTYQKILGIFPDAKEAVRAVSELCLIAYESRDYKKLWSYLESWFANYGEDSSWGQLNSDSLEENAEKTRDSILYYAQKMQEEAQSEKIEVDKIVFSKSFLLKNAKYGYSLYLKLYPSSKRLAEILEYLADVNYTLGEHRNAAKAYRRIVSLPKKEAVLYGKNDKILKNIHKRAAVNMLDSVSRYFSPYYEELLKVIPDFSVPPKKIDSEAKDFMSSCTLYLKNYPEDLAVKKKCYLFSSEIFYKNGHKVKAQKYLLSIASKFRKSKEGALALDKLMSLFENKPEIQVKLAKKFLKYPEYQKSETGDNLRQLLRTVALKRIVQEENKLKRGELYEQYALKNKTDPDSDLIWFNAAIAYLAVGKLDGAIRCFKTIIVNYPKFTKKKDVLLQLANLYEARLEFKESLEYYELFSKIFPQDEAIKGVSQKKCLLSFVERSQKFITNCALFSQKYPEDSKGLVRSFLDFTLYEKNQALYGEILSKLYLKYFKNSKNEKFLAQYDYYEMGIAQNGSRNSFRKKVLSLSSHKSLSGEALAAYAGVYFELFSEKMQSLKFLELKVSSVAVFQKNLQTNFALLKKAEAEGSKILNLKDASSTMKTYAILASLYKKVHLGLKSAPPITGVSKEQLDKDLKPTRDMVFTQLENYTVNAKKIAEDYQVLDKAVFSVKKEFSLLTENRAFSEEWMPSLHFLSLDLEKSFSKKIPFRSE